MVELQPSKLNTWVRFPSPAPKSTHYIKVVWCGGSLDKSMAAVCCDPSGLVPEGDKGLKANFAQIAQLVEHTLGKGEVGSSNLLLGSI